MAGTDFYEPWHPEVGQRVRVRLSGECRRFLHPMSKGGEDGCNAHPEGCDGAIGEIGQCWNPLDPGCLLDRQQGHKYHVFFDELCDGYYTDTFAAIELEPIDE